MAKAKRLPSGNWRVRVYAGKDINGKNIYKSFTSYEKAQAEYEAAGFLAHKKRMLNPLNITLGEAIDKYIESKTNILSPSTISSYKKIRRCNFQSIMDTKLEDITSELLQNTINHESASLSAKTISNAFGLISTTLKIYYPDFVPRVSLPKKQKQYKELLSPEIICKTVKGTDIELPVMLSIWLSLRLSEIRGINKKTDIKDGVLTINNVIVDVDGKPVLKSATKTYDSKRRLKLPPYLQELIDKTETDYIVPISGQAIYKRFTRLLEKNNLPHMRFHDLRHINASIMVKLGVPDKYAMERGGWATNKTLQNVYQHTFSIERQAVDSKIDSYFEQII